MRIKTVAERRENMLWIRTPEKVYFKKGCLPVALDELGTVMHKKRCFIVTDSFLYKNGYTKKIEDKLDQMGIVHTCFYDVEPDPSLASARAGAAAMRMFEPDCIIAMGAGSHAPTRPPPTRWPHNTDFHRPPHGQPLSSAGWEIVSGPEKWPKQWGWTLLRSFGSLTS